MKKWIALFSMSGQEIMDIAAKLGHCPDIIITNREDIPSIFSEVSKTKIKQLSKKPSIEEYRKVLDKEAIITLNGFLRIIPPEICQSFEIYNGHPGLILPEYYPELVGKDPQKRAWQAKHTQVGCVLHKVVATVDAGPILKYRAISNTFATEAELITGLRQISLMLWVEFLQEQLYG